MARFRPGRAKTGGRKKGVRNRATQQRIDAAERAVELTRAGGKRLARDVLEDFMEIFSATAMANQDNEGKFEKYAKLSVEIASTLIEYQSPKLRALMVNPNTFAQQNGNGSGNERLSREELAQKLIERGLPPRIFAVDVPKLEVS